MTSVLLSTLSFDEESEKRSAVNEPVGIAGTFDNICRIWHIVTHDLLSRLHVNNLFSNLSVKNLLMNIITARLSALLRRYPQLETPTSEPVFEDPLQNRICKVLRLFDDCCPVSTLRFEKCSSGKPHHLDDPYNFAGRRSCTGSGGKAHEINYVCGSVGRDRKISSRKSTVLPRKILWELRTWGRKSYCSSLLNIEPLVSVPRHTPPKSTSACGRNRREATNEHNMKCSTSFWPITVQFNDTSKKSFSMNSWRFVAGFSETRLGLHSDLFHDPT